MKQVTRPLLFAGMIVALVLAGTAVFAGEIWVAPNGSDQAPGTKDAPMATLAAALRKAREWRRLSDPGIKDGIRILLEGGVYPLTEPVFIRPEDSGTESSPTVIEAAPGEEPVLSGGRTIPGWEKLPKAVPGLPGSARGQVWVADVPRDGGAALAFRELWVNGRKAIRAREVNDDDSMNRILALDRRQQAIWIPATGHWLRATGHWPRATGDPMPAKAGGRFPADLRGRFSADPRGRLPADPAGMEMIIHQMWAIAVLRIRTIEREGDRLKLTFCQPESRLEFEHPWPAPVIDSGHRQNGNSAYYLANAIQFLDRPGEWYEDLANGKLYYWPRPGEDLVHASVIVPALTTLVRVRGTIDRPVTHIQWKGIAFSYSTWMRPSEQGHVPLQAGMFLLDAYKLKVPGTPDKKDLENQAWIGRPPGAVEVSYASHMLFRRCRFLHLASTGLDFVRGTEGDSVTGCLFKDIGGTGIQVGVYSDPAVETHLLYNPTDPREVCRNESICDNLVTDCTNEDWGCVGIGAGYVKNILIQHNEVSEVSYSGICVGWGWTKTVNCMSNNRIVANYVHHYARHLYDVGGIYTLSAQPGTVIMDNRIDSIYHPAYAHDPKHWFWFYFDEGSSYITIKDNWCPGEKFMRNSNGPGNTWENNGAMVDEKIKDAAGLEPAYRMDQ